MRIEEPGSKPREETSPEWIPVLYGVVSALFSNNAPNANLQCVMPTQDKKPSIIKGYWFDKSRITIHSDYSETHPLIRFGDTVEIDIQTENVPDGTQVNIKIYEDDPIVNDYVKTLTGTVKNNQVFVSVPLTQDFYKKGEEELVSKFYFEASISVKGQQIKETLPRSSNDYLVVRPTHQVVFLTFDDGPIKGTDKVLAVLNKTQVKGTFFVVGQRAERDDWSKNLLRQIYSNSNFCIGNHGYSHAGEGDDAKSHGDYEKFYKNMGNLPNVSVLLDFQKADKVFSKILTGLESASFKYARLPGRNSWRVGDLYGDLSWGAGFFDSSGEADLLKSAGYKIYGWDVEWHGPKKITDETIMDSVKTVFNNVQKSFDTNEPVVISLGFRPKKNKVILLMHEFMFKTDTSKLEELIKKLKFHRYETNIISKY